MRTKKIIYPLVALLILAVIWFFVIFYLRVYQMHIYLNDEPSDLGAREIKECYSFTGDFDCAYKQDLITAKYIKAVTYKKDQEISDSGWKLIEG